MNCCCWVLSCLWLFVAPGTAACQAPLSFTTPQTLLTPMPRESAMPSNHLIHYCPLLLTSVFPSIRVFSNELTLCIQWPKCWSFSFSHQSFQWIFRTDFFEDGLVESPCSPKDSQESSPTPQFKSINSSGLSFFYSPTLIPIHDYRKNHSFD